MFDSLKSKLKNIFSKGKDLKEESVYKEAEPERPAEEEQTVSPAPPASQEPAARAPEAPSPEAHEAAPAAPAEEHGHFSKKGKSRKEGRASDMLSDSFLAKKIKDDPMDMLRR